MATPFRDRAWPVTSRHLVIRPQRAMGSVLRVLGGTLCALVSAIPAARAIQQHSVGLLPFTLPWVLVGGFVALRGMHGWLLKVDIRAYSDGALMMTWGRWVLGRRVRFLRLSDVTDVIVDSKDDESRIVVVAGPERIPLTGNWTIGLLAGEAERLHEFLGRPRAGRPC